MINSMQKALIIKDLKGIVGNKRLFSVLLIVPLVMVVFVPSVFVLMMAFVPEETGDFAELLALLPVEQQGGDLALTVAGLLLNSIMPVFFLLIPIMAASVMAASSFVGEKEKRTLETLLYSPLPLAKVFQAKIFASFLLSMATSLASFAAMILVFELEVWLTMGALVPPDAAWPALLLLVAPALSLIAITLIVKGSAKAKTMEESQQRSVFLILPVMLLAVGQFSGLLLINVWMLLALGAALAVVAFFMLRGSAGRFTYENLLR